MFDTVILMPCILSFFLMLKAIVSTAKLNNKADTGHRLVQNSTKLEFLSIEGNMYKIGLLYTYFYN